MPKEITAIAMAKATLVDQVRDMILEIVQDMGEGWDKLGEFKEGIVIEQASAAATRAVLGCCDIIAGDGRDLLDCHVGNVTAHKTTYNAAISVMHDTAGAMDLVRAAHGMAKLAFVDTDKYTGEKTRPDARPDQRDMLHDTSDTAAAIKEGVQKAAAAKLKKHPGLPDPEAIKEHMNRQAEAEAKKEDTDKPEDAPKKTAARKAPTRRKATTAAADPKKTAQRKRVTRGSVDVKGKNGRNRVVNVETKKARKEEAAATFALPEDLTPHDDTSLA